MKKALILGFVLSLVILTLGSCSKKEEAAAGGEAMAEQLKVGMVTDAGTIDDKSFNQGTWEGILAAKKDMNLDTKYLKPTGTTEADYLKEIGNLYDAGYKFIVTPGFQVRNCHLPGSGASTKTRTSSFWTVFLIPATITPR